MKGYFFCYWVIFMVFRYMILDRDFNCINEFIIVIYKEFMVFLDMSCRKYVRRYF